MMWIPFTACPSHDFGWMQMPAIILFIEQEAVNKDVETFALTAQNQKTVNRYW